MGIQHPRFCSGILRAWEHKHPGYKVGGAWGAENIIVDGLKR